MSVSSAELEAMAAAIRETTAYQAVRSAGVSVFMVVANVEAPGATVSCEPAVPIAQLGRMVSALGASISRDAASKVAACGSSIAAPVVCSGSVPKRRRR